MSLKLWLIKGIVFLLVLLLTACQQEDTPLPTTAPRIPTMTLTPRPTSTPSLMPIVGTLPPTSDVNQPTWTPTLTSTQPASATPRPSHTPTHTPTPAQLGSSAESLPDGTVRLNLLAADLTQANRLRVEFAIEPDVMTLTFDIPNAFLGQSTQIQALAAVNLDESQNQLILILNDFSAQGPQVTRLQVQDKIAETATFLNAYLRSEFTDAIQQETDAKILNVSLKANFLVVDMVTQ